MKEYTVRDSVEINASASKVWDVLTKPELTKQYMFGCETVSDWKQGSDLLWRGSMDGREVIFVRGKILKIEPHRFLEYTTFDPNAGMEDILENHLSVTYRLSPKHGGTLLEVSQGDFAKRSDPEKHYQEAVAGWATLIQKIKELAERKD